MGTKDRLAPLKCDAVRGIYIMDRIEALLYKKEEHCCLLLLGLMISNRIKFRGRHNFWRILRVN